MNLLAWFQCAAHGVPQHDLKCTFFDVALSDNLRIINPNMVGSVPCYFFLQLFSALLQQEFWSRVLAFLEASLMCHLAVPLCCSAGFHEDHPTAHITDLAYSNYCNAFFITLTLLDSGNIL